ncbi:RHS repeat domain-containing protein [Paludibaculum fermentans]|uniref:RHS repeat protein n=1 Tax=Paludibaculum fermentans TaxID=1473598 RepID=A0A7S7SPI4_PALFE|nr:RHS repeat domain-containing protein [Paludibaculum fermentans]QOY91165.1 RHS repeat protein [Paludibaculum fermentans]
MLRTIGLLAILAVALAAAPIKYSYDAAGRLTKADYGDGRVITYTYDAAGNLLRRDTATQAKPQSEAKPPAGSKEKATR